MNQITDSFLLGGGLDLTTPAIVKRPGVLIGSINHEPALGGYRRIGGFERVDGQPAPSAASYWVLNFITGTAAIAEGSVVTGLTSGATGKALIAGVVTSGTYGGGNAAGYLVLTAVSGTFQNGENLQVAAVTKCVASGTATNLGASNDTDNTTWLRDAIDTARALIGAVPGSGALRGGWVYNGVRYAFRDNAGVTAVDMYKSTASGWSLVALGRSLAFTSGGTYVIAEGNTITGATSAATAVITRVVLTSGTWAGGDAAGRLIFASQAGTFQAENLNVGANLNVATIAGNSAAITLPLGGRYEFRNHNFGGGTNTYRMYGVNGVGTGFEFDGTVFVPIVTGMIQDTPTHIEVNHDHLIYSFTGGSMQHSGVGNPYVWTPLLGAAEIGIGDNITGMLSGVAQTMAIYGRNSTSVLYGTSSADWQLQDVSREAGAVEWTLQHLNTPVYYDDGGVRSLSATQRYGDFQSSTLSFAIQPLLDAKRTRGVNPVASIRSKRKNQYRLFFSDGTGIVMDMSAKAPAFCPVNYGKVMSFCNAAEDSDGSEVLLFGSSDGYLYEMDSGTSFDGAVIEAYVRLAFSSSGAPYTEKRYHGAAIEVDAANGTVIYGSAEFDYANPDAPSSIETAITMSGSGGFWNEMIWNEFVWSSQVVGQMYMDIDGLGSNISLAIYSSLVYDAPYTISGVTYRFSPRKMQRRAG